ncbi:Nodulation protein S (NodS) [Pseudonocardia ammonioxydans]|uniref:Nodulation protein S (NodS) n=1 Tax=Pseudonocardia ammonioxydans TaxID=260086 RepID=A0A1I5GYT2_PSUAM|nr:SAM-dependent methyltransferase [Pseudonocardia ammonioxydans]SFO41107.1 Nodulation protein S (NodS) [Pseudonocardia ammonioxydans]
MPNLRQAIRRAINRSTGLATAPLRSLAAATLRRRPELTARFAEWSWLWQPSWGKSMQQSLFSSGIDPYDLATNSYEQQKYADIIRVLGDRHVTRGLEVGCAEGLFTESLAALCEELVAVDISEIAVARAQNRLREQTGIRIERRTLPLDYPEGVFDLIVCSDVLYLWQRPTLEIGLRKIVSSLRPGGRLLLQHYRGHFGAPFTGDEVHDLAIAVRVDGATLRAVHTERGNSPDPDDHRSEGYRIDLLERQV